MGGPLRRLDLLRHTLLLSSSYLLLLLLSRPAAAAAQPTCNTFVPLGANATFTASSTDPLIRISRGVACPAHPPHTATLHRTTCTDSCPVILAGTLSLVGTNNLSLPAALAAPLYPVVARALSANFSMLAHTIPSLALRNSSGNVACAPAGATGYFAAGAAALTCVSGRFFACPHGAPLADGQPVELCAPVRSETDGPGPPAPALVTSWVEQGPAVTSLTDYPAATGPVSSGAGEASYGRLRGQQVARVGVAGLAAAAAVMGFV